MSHTVQLELLDQRYRTLRLARPAAVVSLKESIGRHGVLHPLVVNRLDGGNPVLLDGFKRFDALVALDVAEAPARFVTLDEPAARAAVLTCNAGQRSGLCELEEAWVVRSLVRTCGLKQTEVAELLGRHKSWVCRRLLLAEELAEPVRDDLRLGLVAPTVARELARLPRGNQERVAQVVRDHGLTSRQTADLVARHLETEAGDALDALLGDPLKYLARPPAPATGPRDPRLSGPGDQVRGWLVRLDQAVAGTTQILGRFPAQWLSAADRQVLGPMAADARHRCARLLAALTVLAESPGPARDDA